MVQARHTFMYTQAITVRVLIIQVIVTLKSDLDFDHSDQTLTCYSGLSVRELPYPKGIPHSNPHIHFDHQTKFRVYQVMYTQQLPYTYPPPHPGCCICFPCQEGQVPFSASPVYYYCVHSYLPKPFCTHIIPPSS